jgi:hypothetical protein
MPSSRPSHLPRKQRSPGPPSLPRLPNPSPLWSLNPERAPASVPFALRPLMLMPRLPMLPPILRPPTLATKFPTPSTLPPPARHNEPVAGAVGADAAEAQAAAANKPSPTLSRQLP